jgi:hypothetical protein
VLEIARNVEIKQMTNLEVQHASSDLCPSLDLETSPDSNH